MHRRLCCAGTDLELLHVLDRPAASKGDLHAQLAPVRSSAADASQAGPCCRTTLYEIMLTFMPSAVFGEPLVTWVCRGKKFMPLVWLTETHSELLPAGWIAAASRASRAPTNTQAKPILF